MLRVDHAAGASSVLHVKYGIVFASSSLVILALRSRAGLMISMSAYEATDPDSILGVAILPERRHNQL